jgi:hypothetical protein
MKYLDENYIVYLDGRIWSHKLNRFLKQSINIKGYLQVSINKKTKLIHRIIAELFIPNINNFSQVNHINGDKLDNRIENLEWVTNRENTNHYHNSKYPGVNITPSGKYRAKIRIQGKLKHIGTFYTPEEAYQAYLNMIPN